MKKNILISTSVIITIIAFFSWGQFKKNKTESLFAKKGDVKEAIYGLGTVKADKVFEVKTGIMTTIKNLHVKEGDFVKKDASLITFEDKITFKAPFNGTVTVIDYQEGEIAIPNVPLLRLEDISNKYIEVSLEQEAALRVRPDQKATVIFESLTGFKLEGIVKSIYPKRGEFITHILVPNLKAEILPGMTADVVIEVGSKKDVLLIPLRSIVDGQVSRKRNGKRQKIDVEIGHTDGAFAEVIRGDIQLDDELIVKRK
jgi:membrane fusion protein, macrolide-specific efflux system